jgi:hypothetical protein
MTRSLKRVRYTIWHVLKSLGDILAGAILLPAAAAISRRVNTAAIGTHLRTKDLPAWPGTARL